MPIEVWTNGLVTRVLFDDEQDLKGWKKALKSERMKKEDHIRNNGPNPEDAVENLEN